MIFLANLVGSEHIERFIPVAEAQNERAMSSSPGAAAAAPDPGRDELAAGREPKPGTQEPGRYTVEPLGGPTSLTQMVSENHDYRGEW